MQFLHLRNQKQMISVIVLGQMVCPDGQELMLFSPLLTARR